MMQLRRLAQCCCQRGWRTRTAHLEWLAGESTDADEVVHQGFDPKKTGWRALESVVEGSAFSGQCGDVPHVAAFSWSGGHVPHARSAPG